eukprot:COSAG04_NODE_3168_length_3093_cov_83.308897_1_plen_862_part_10
MSSKKAAKRGKKKRNKGDAKAAARGTNFAVAASNGDCSAITRHLDSGLDINALVELKNTNGQPLRATALVHALVHNQLTTMRLLLDRGANPNLADSKGITPLMIAAGVGPLPLMQLLVEAKADIGAVDQLGNTAFHYACFTNHPECAEALVRAGCDTNLLDKRGETGRDVAQRKGHTVVLERLAALELHRPSPAEEEQSKVGVKEFMSSALLDAMVNGQEAAAQLLLDRGANPNLADSDGITPLMIAAGTDWLPLLRLLVEAKAEVDAVEPRTGWTAFHATCVNNLPECAEVLVRAGCDTSLRAKDGKTGRDMAQDQGNAAVLERLDALESAQKDEAKAGGVDTLSELGAAAKTGNCPVITRLMDSGGLDINEMLHYDYNAVCFEATALHKGYKNDAAARLLFDAVLPLVEAEIDAVDVLDAAGGTVYLATALHTAVAYKQEMMVRLLLERKADPNLPNSDGITPLMNAATAATSKLRLLKLLLKAKAEVDTVNPNGWTAFHYSCNYNHPDIAEALIRAGCDTSLRDMNGMTGRDMARMQGYTAVLTSLVQINNAADLVDAAKSGSCSAMDRVLEHGELDIDAMLKANNDGRSYLATALHTAVANKQGAAVRLLLERRANPNLASSLGDTPLMIAVFKGSLALLQPLLEAKAEMDTVNPATGGTAFHFTCHLGNPDIAEALVQAGCDTSLRTKKGGMTGRDLAQEHGHQLVLKRLDLVAARPSWFLRAAEAGDCGTMERLLEDGVDIDAMSEWTSKGGKKVRTNALYGAVVNQQVAAVRLLLDRGANPNLANSLGGTPLMAALGTGSLSLVRLLTEANAEVDAVDSDGGTAFHYTCIYNWSDCAETLVRAGCDTSLRDMEGK